MGRRTAASGDSAPAGGLSSQDAPPISLLVLPKEKRAVHGPKRKNAFGALRCSGPPRARGAADRCLLRFCLAFGHAIIFCKFATAVPWRMVRRASRCKNVFDQLLFPHVPLARKGHAASVSGKAANGCAVATRSPGRRRGLVPAGGRGRPPLQRGDGFWHPRRGRCLHRPVVPAPINHRLAAAEREAGCIPDFPGPKDSPRAVRFRP